MFTGYSLPAIVSENRVITVVHYCSSVTDNFIPFKLLLQLRGVAVLLREECHMPQMMAHTFSGAEVMR